MKFKIQVKMLEHWLKIAATALGKSAVTQTVDGYYFRQKDGMLEIIGTDKKNFAIVRTSTQLEAEGEPFALKASVLDTLISYSSGDAEVSFEVLSRLDSGEAVVRVECGDYVGKSLISLDPKNFPELFPVFDHDQLEHLNIDKFCNSVSRVKYVLEGITTSDYVREVVFRCGQCFVGSPIRYQEVSSGFDENVDISIPFEALKCVKFLELTRQNPKDEFAFAESSSHLYFYVGQHCFVSDKTDEKTKKRQSDDYQKEFNAAIEGTKSLSFQVDTGKLYRAMVLASVTCEQSSAEIIFEFEKGTVFVVGKDRHDNSAYVQLDVHIKADTSKLLESVRGAGWNWLVSALMGTGGKSVLVQFDKGFAVFKNEKARSFCPLAVKHNVKRTVTS